jgi:hypothetical protein
VDEVQIKVFKLKIIESFIESCQGFLVTALGVPNFARDKQFLSVYTRLDNALTDTCFVTIDGSGIYVPIPFPRASFTAPTAAVPSEICQVPNPRQGIVALLYKTKPS